MKQNAVISFIVLSFAKAKIYVLFFLNKFLFSNWIFLFVSAFFTFAFRTEAVKTDS